MALALVMSVLCACGVGGTDAHPVRRSNDSAPELVRARQATVEQDQISIPASGVLPAKRIGNAASLSPRSGQLLGTRRFDNTLLGVDLATGHYRSVAGNSELAGLGVARSDASVETRRDRSVDSGAVLTVDDCIEERAETICVLFTDRDGNVEESFGIDGRFPGPAKVSFDGEYVAIERSDRAAGASVFTVFTRDGDFVASHAQTAGLDREGAYDWLPDGRLAFSIEGNELLGDAQPTGFFITDPFDPTPRRRITLPDFYQGGRIQTIESSPDGRQLLINVEPRVGPRRPILVDLDTLAVTQLIERNDGSVTDVRNVVWGPGGNWVYVAVPTSKLLSGTALDGGTVVFIGSFDSLFAYRVDGTTHPMPFEPSDLSASVQLIPTDDPDRPGGQVGGGQFEGDLAWIP